MFKSNLAMMQIRNQVKSILLLVLHGVIVMVRVCCISVNMKRERSVSRRLQVTSQLAGQRTLNVQISHPGAINIGVLIRVGFKS